jgi:hypothetical protein
VRPTETPLHGRTLACAAAVPGVLSRAEVDAAIGHELAHFVGEDTEYSLRFVPIYDGVSRSLETLTQTMMDSDLIQGWLMRPSFLFGCFSCSTSIMR